MSYELKYPGRRESHGQQRCFRSICPVSSDTAQKQKRRFNPPGLTLVAHIPHEDRRPFREAIDIIKGSGRNFQDCEQLHFTILGLFAEDLQNPLDGDTIDNLISAITEFFRVKPIGRIEVAFDLIRPGVFDREPECGDGTVVAMASEAHDKIIVEYSKQLAAHLASAYPNLFPKSPARHLRGVWCSLGFFDDPDFEIDEKTSKAFANAKLMSFSASAPIREVSVCEFTLKSLADGIVRGVVRL